jgi:hypothetical protein
MGLPDETGVFTADDTGAICWFYRMHGYVVIRDIFDPDRLGRMTDDCQQLQHKVMAGQMSDRYFARDSWQPGQPVNHIGHIDELSPVVRQTAEEPPLRDIMTELLGPDCWPGHTGGRCISYQEARAGTDSRYSRIGWHADWQAAPSLNIYPKISFTFHIDATSPHNGFLRVVPGSHLWATPVPHVNINNTTIPASARQVGGYTDAAPPFPMPLGFEKIRGEVAVYAEAGDVLLHDGFLWHAAARATDDTAVRRHVRGSYFSGDVPASDIVTERVLTAAF